jgi:spore coat polysaccharide biosynthesis predicted glycosyltransferase SpsG
VQTCYSIRDQDAAWLQLSGDDPFRLTLKVMEALEEVRRPLRVTVVIGPAFFNEEEIREKASCAQHRYDLQKNVPNMAELMCQTDLAVTGGGLTALEVACTGTPALIICEVAHQVDTARALECQGAVVNLGLGESLEPLEIAGHVESLLADPGRRLQLSQAGKSLVDGRGVERIRMILVSKLEELNALTAHAA